MAAERILVTGANGFIGANMTRRLVHEGADVVPAVGPSGEKWRIDDLPIEPIKLDVTDFDNVVELIEKYKPSHIINLATYGVYRDQKEAQLIYHTNATGIANIAKAALGSQIDMVINTGSVFEYGSLPGMMSEEMIGEIRNPYDEAKIAGTNISNNFYQQFGLPIVTLRLFTTYGPFEDSRRLVAGTILKMLREQEVIMSPDSIRDFVYVNDVVDAYMATLDNPQAVGEIINIGSGQPHTVGEVVNLIARESDSKSTITSTQDYVAANDSKCWANIDKARQIINWSPQTTLEEGLRETIEWYKTNSIKYK
jgi:nucleoside-diphosphate-sugar epimerase